MSFSLWILGKDVSSCINFQNDLSPVLVMTHSWVCFISSLSPFCQQGCSQVQLQNRLKQEKQDHLGSSPSRSGTEQMWNKNGAVRVGSGQSSMRVKLEKVRGIRESERNYFVFIGLCYFWISRISSRWILGLITLYNYRKWSQKQAGSTADWNTLGKMLTNR